MWYNVSNNFLILITGFLIFVNYAFADIKLWIRNTNFNNSNNWIPRRLPTENDLVVFPFALTVEVMLMDHVSICEMILPYLGEIFMPRDGSLKINSLHCDSSNKVTFVRRQREKWENPANWWMNRKNKAIPHSFRIPCPYDDVMFPPSSTFAVALPPLPTTVKSFHINFQDLDSEKLRSFLVDSPVGRKQFYWNYQDETLPLTVSGVGCQDPTGCSCGTERLLKLSCNLFSSRLCSRPKCRDPVKPIGHCCEVCGGVMEFHYDPKKFKMTELRIMLDSYVTLVENQQKADLVYHVGKTDSGTIQLVLMERDRYEGVISDALDQLKKDILSDEKLGLTLTKMLLAGEPYDPDAVSFVFKTFFAMILMIIVGFLCFIMYKSDLNFGRLFSTSNLTNFVRFENQTGEVELRYEVQPTFRKSFHNPLSAILQTVSGNEESTKPDLKPEEQPSTSFGNLALEAAAIKPQDEMDNVEMDEISASKVDEKLLHDVDLS